MPGFGRRTGTVVRHGNPGLRKYSEIKERESEYVVSKMEAKSLGGQCIDSRKRVSMKRERDMGDRGASDTNIMQSQCHTAFLHADAPFDSVIIQIPGCKSSVMVDDRSPNEFPADRMASV